MISLTWGGTDKQLQVYLGSGSTQLRQALVRTVDRLMLQLQANIQRKLSGEVLEHKSGRLLGSVIKGPTEDSGGRITGLVTGAGGPAFYGRIQEKGGTRTYEILPVKKKALAFFPKGSLGGGGGIAQLNKSIIRNLHTRSGASRGELKKGSLKKFSSFGGVVVQKVIHPPLQPRPFMKPALDEMKATIIEQIRATIMTALKKKG